MDNQNNFNNNQNNFNSQNMGNGSRPMPMNNGMPMNNNRQNKPKKKSKGLGIIIGIVAILILLIIVVIAIPKGDKEPIVDNPVIEEPIEEPVEEPIDEPIEEPIEEPVEEPIDEVKYSYDNPIIGVKFNYDSSLYAKDNIVEVQNLIKSVIPEGETVFNLYNHKLPNILNVLKLTTGDADGLYISVSLMPFEIEKSTTTLKIDGSTEVKNESIAAINLTDAELVEKYDTQIKETLAQTNCEIVTYNQSTVDVVGSDNVDSKLKGIFTSRVYTGPVDVTTSSGMVDVLQCTIPVGRNAIIVTAVTDGSPTEIDKSAIFNQIINIMIVTAEIPVEENVEEKAE